MGNDGDKRRTTRDGRKIILAKMPTSTLAGRGEEKQFEKEENVQTSEGMVPAWEITPQKIIFRGVRGGDSLLYHHHWAVPGHVYAAALQFSLCFLYLFAFSCGFPFAPLSCCCHLPSPQVLGCSLPQKVVGKLLGPAAAEWALLARGPACC